jgi:hypothetical protein
MILKNCKEQGIKINNWKYNKREREKQSNGWWYFRRLLERCKTYIKTTSTRKKRKLF